MSAINAVPFLDSSISIHQFIHAELTVKDHWEKYSLSHVFIAQIVVG